ncbi:hypothetical protein [Methylocapsa sp. S129]|uniref:hypothetical protein n=1 Tax=Methylocapsa sp. S129 TaxID=1641869 RepID=UPI00131DD55B|nr:hypothetical protein [Methylocapsa sp. S129]
MAARKTQHFSHQPVGAATVNDAPDSVIPVAYALAKAKSEHDAIAIMRDIPSAIYPALKAHLTTHPNLFLPEVRATVVRIMGAPKLSAAEALFA